MAYIYCITNDINGKQYVGKTEHTIEERFKEHCSDCFKEQCEKRPLYAAMRKYGIEHFTISILEETNTPEEREIYWIEKLGTFKKGYNATKGGDGKHYLDYDLIISTYQEIQNCTEVAKILGCHVDSVYNVLRNNNIEIIPSTVIAQRKFGKIVKQYTKDTHDLIAIFPSLAAAERELGIQRCSRHISECCQHKRKSAYGYCWEFG